MKGYSRVIKPSLSSLCFNPQIRPYFLWKVGIGVAALNSHEGIYEVYMMAKYFILFSPGSLTTKTKRLVEKWWLFCCKKDSWIAWVLWLNTCSGAWRVAPDVPLLFGNIHENYTPISSATDGIWAATRHHKQQPQEKKNPLHLSLSLQAFFAFHQQPQKAPGDSIRDLFILWLDVTIRRLTCSLFSRSPDVFSPSQTGHGHVRRITW